MGKNSLILGLFFIVSTTQVWAETSIELEDEIILVDETPLSGMVHKGPILSCNDHAKEKELSCSKEPKDIILSKLPTSKQLSETNLDDDKDLNEIKFQLTSVITELSKLKKEQKSNHDTIEELRALVKVLSSKKIETPVEKMKKVTKVIEKIKPKVIKHKSGEKITTTLIRKKIKEIERFDDHVIIEVQRNESLSTYAQAYYNDNKQYYRIYKANKSKIGKNLQIIIGDRLTIPLD
ncbi:MAG: hypothetical protein KAG56_04655 [Sulfurovaceae bacterium]|nr:hypothetical protein [Sulfurovaceae bacterium]